MAEPKALIQSEADGSLSFGDYTLDAKTKKDGFEYQGDLYKVKTFREITKLEKNGMMVYESVPGTAVDHFQAADRSVSFRAEGKGDTQITLEMEADSAYQVYLNDTDLGEMTTGLGAKLSLSADLSEGPAQIRVVKK